MWYCSKLTIETQELRYDDFEQGFCLILVSLKLTLNISFAGRKSALLNLANKNTVKFIDTGNGVVC